MSDDQYFESKDAIHSAIVLHRESYEKVKSDLNDLKAESANLSDATRAENSKKFEYLFTDDIDEQECDRLGLKGWELVSCASYTVGFGFGGNTSLKVHLRYVFKRQISEEISEEAQEMNKKIVELEGLRLKMADYGNDLIQKLTDF